LIVRRTSGHFEVCGICGLDSAGIGTFGGSGRESPSGEFQRAGQSAQHRGVLNGSATIWDAQRFREPSASTEISILRTSMCPKRQPLQSRREFCKIQHLAILECECRP
jgi:hypothetical protein